MKRHELLTAIPLLCASLACGGDGGVAPARGSLEVTIAGLPTGQSASVTVTGPANTSQPLTATATLNDLAAGSYDIRSLNVTSAGVVYVPTPATQTIAVTGGSTARATVTYASTSAFTLRAQQIVEGLATPVYLTAPKDDPRLFVVEQAGRIRIVKSGALVATPFLDITSRVVSEVSAVFSAWRSIRRTRRTGGSTCTTPERKATSSSSGSRCRATPMSRTPRRTV
jgi:hypothetical protein